MKSLSIYITVFAIILLTSCVKEYDETILTPGEIEEPKRIINSDLSGSILYDNRKPLGHATVSIGNVSTSTNDNGKFKFDNIEMDAEGQLIKITKEGFFDQYKLIYPEVGKDPYISALMLDKDLQGNFQSELGGTIQCNRIQIDFQPSSIVDSQNQFYDGEVLVFQAPINPDDNDFDLITPGNLRSRNEEGDNTILQSYAMSVIKLESPDGQALNIREGHSAELTFDIPETHLDYAPESIPLWYFDEQTGYWVEDGLASKIGSKYIGDITHFSFWNCDVANLAFKLSFRLITTNGQPVANSIVRLKGPNDLISNSVYSDANGYVSGLIPGLLDLQLLVFGENINCGTLETFALGSFSEDTDLGDITITGESHIVPVKANIVDCNASPIPFAEVLIYTTDVSSSEDYYELTADVDGNIAFFANKCSYYNGQYQVTHPTTGVKSPIIRYNGILNENEVSDLGEIIHCVDTTPKLQLSTNSSSYTATDVLATVSEEDINGDKSIIIESTDGTATFDLEIELVQVSDQLEMYTVAFNYDASGIFGINGSCGGCGLNVFGPPIRGVIGEVINISFPLDPDDPTSSNPLIYVDLNVLISQ